MRRVVEAAGGRAYLKDVYNRLAEMRMASTGILTIETRAGHEDAAYQQLLELLES